MRWVFLLLGTAFMLGLGVAIGQRLDEVTLPLTLGVSVGLVVSVPVGLLFAWFAMHATQSDATEEGWPAEEGAELPDPAFLQTEPPTSQAAWEHALREQVAAERAVLAQMMEEHAYEQATAQMDPHADPRIVVVPPPAPYVASGYTAPQGLYPPPEAPLPYPSRRFTVIGGTEITNDEHSIA